MKTIPLKTVHAIIGEKETDLSYKKQIAEVMRTPSGDKGADYEEIRHSLRILDLLDKANEHLELEDADFEYMKQRILSTRWPIIAPALMQFIEDVTNG